MPRKSVKKVANRNAMTVGEMIDLVKRMESQLRTLRMLLQRLDKTTEVKLTAEIKRTLKAQALVIPSLEC